MHVLVVSYVHLYSCIVNFQNFLKACLNSLHAGVILYAFCRLLNVFQNEHFQKFLGMFVRVSNSLDSDQAWPDLGPNCLQRVSADDTGRERESLFCGETIFEATGYSFFTISYCISYNMIMIYLCII